MKLCNRGLKMDNFEQNNFNDDNNSDEVDFSEVNGSDGAFLQNSNANADYADEYARYVEKKRFNKTPLVLALWGLVFSVFYGAGMVLGIIALVIAARRYKIQKSEPLKWAIIVSITCIALSFAFISAMTGAAVIAIMRQVPEETAYILSGI